MRHLFIDLRNTYLQVKKHYDARVDLSAFEGYYRKILVTTFTGKAAGFYAKATKLDYIIEAVYSSYASHQVGKRDSEVVMALAVKVLEYLDDITELDIASNNEALIPFIKWIQNRGVKVRVISPYVSDNLLEIIDQWVRLDERFILPA